MFIAALFIIARTWKQPRCPSADEWIRKLWYIYTMEYYSAIKKNTFESVLMRWMKLESIIQSEVSQKEKHQYSILTHILEKAMAPHSSTLAWEIPGMEPASPALQTHSLAVSYSVQFSSVARSCLTLCNPINCSSPGLPVHHQLLEFTQTNFHRVGDAIQPSHPLLSPSTPASNLSQHQSLFQ